VPLTPVPPVFSVSTTFLIPNQVTGNWVTLDPGGEKTYTVTVRATRKEKTMD
jgi:hypothetical protein